MGISGIVVTAYVLIKEKGWHLKSKKDLAQLIVFGAVFTGVYYTVEGAGISMTSGPISSLIMTTVPILGMLADRVLYGRPITPVKIIGIIGSVAGVAMIVFGTGSGNARVSLLGVLVMFAAAFLWASYIVLADPFSRKCSLASFLSIMFLSGTAACAVIALIQSRVYTLKADFTPAVCILICVSALICILLCEIIYIYSIRKLSVTTVTLANNLLPLVTILFSFFVFGQTMSAVQLIGGALIIICVSVITAKE
jgi:drug/metabolite transporter (DMT)-like permease